jgi:signal transduction histidine kinase
MISRLYYFTSAAVARLVERLPGDFERRALGAEPADVKGPGVILVDAVVGQLERALVLRREVDALEIVVLGDVSALPAAPSEHVYAYLVSTLPTAIIAQALTNAFLHAQLRQEQTWMKEHIERTTAEVQQLAGIGIALSAERDTLKLLSLILQKAREITHADAGTLYLVEQEAGRRHLRFAIVQNDSLAVAFEGTRLAIDARSAAGHVAGTGLSLNLEDVYAGPPGLAFDHDRTYDQKTGYHTKSMLAVPMTTPDGRVVGVVQLINCKADPARRFASREEIEREARSFPARFEDLASAVAALAAVALENSRLYAELEAALTRVQASQQRIVQAERLRAVAEMAGGLAHDFNNALAAILGRAQLLQAQIDEPELRRGLRVIEDAAMEGARTIRRIMEFARKRRERPFQPVELNELLAEVVELTRPRWRDEAQAKGLSYDVRLETAPVPPVAGDPSELREALLNVVLNALDAMPAGGQLTLRTHGEGDRVRCEVIDTGVGMSDDMRHRIFEPFFTTKEEKGSGLGLSVMYGIIARHSGDVEVESRPGEGTAFTIRLPAAIPVAVPAAPSPEIRTAPVAPAPAPTERPAPAARVLVIDDEMGVREVLAETLRHEGYRVTSCANGHQGVASFDAEPFDLVVTDLGMPGVSGWEVAEHVKRRNPRIPVVLVTGWGDRFTPEEVRERGVDFLVAKPFSLDHVRAIARRALALHPA